MTNNDLMPWIDVETFGLDITDPILEVGIVVTNLELEIIEYESWLVWEPDLYNDRLDQLSRDAQRGVESAQYVLDMHTKSGLWSDAQESGWTREQVDRGVAEFLSDCDAVGLPYFGSSVHADKYWITEQMPLTADSFHYRIVDNSTLKELCRRYNPELFKHAPIKQKGTHRVLDDLHDSIDEFRFYRDEFLMWRD